MSCCPKGYTVVENFHDDFSDDCGADFVRGLHLCNLAKFVLQYEQVPEKACASINYVSPAKIHELNLQYRNIDSATDVLSFECDGVEDDFYNPNLPYELGDIFICLEVAQANSEKFNTSLTSELRLLVVHGMLHLCGYDHMEENEAKQMEATEEEILDLWNEVSSLQS